MSFLKKIIIWILILESRLILRKYRPYIVAVTGSVGKTSTKDAIFCVLKGQSKFARKSEKSFNSDIGLPLTVIGVPNAWKNPRGWLRNIFAGLKLILRHSEYPDCLVLEIGADHPGDVRNVAKWLQPDIAVITKVSRMPVHVEFFKSPEEVFEEKASLTAAVKAGGALVLLADDEKVMSIPERLAPNTPRVITFGTDNNATVRCTQVTIEYDAGRQPIGIIVNLHIDGNLVPISIKGIIGSTYQFPLAAAAAVGKARGLDADTTVRSLAEYEAPKGRMNIIQGLNGSTIIDDSYNSSPDAASAALATLKGVESVGDKVAVLGDMMELGKYSIEEHRKIGREAATIVSQLITIGPRSRATAEEAVSNGLPASSVRSFDTAREAAVYLPSLIKSGDIILVKGSQSVRAERVVKALMRESDRASELLVRQEKEWVER